MADRDWLGFVGGLVGALIGSVGSVYIAWSDHRRDDEGDKRELRVLACDLHMGLVRSGILNHGPNASRPNITVPRIKMSEYETLSLEKFKNLSQKIMSDIDYLRKSIKSVSEDEENASGYQDPEETLFIYESDPKLYDKASRDIRGLDSASVNLAKDVISYHMLLQMPNYCEIGRDP